MVVFALCHRHKGKKIAASGRGIYPKRLNTNNSTWENIKNKLNNNEAAIEFMHFNNLKLDNTYEDIYCAIIITKDFVSPKIVKLFEVNELENILRKIGSNNLNYINTIYGSNAAKKTKLYNIIWQPIDSVLKNINTVYISPTGLLHKVSFAAISTNDNKYLSDIYTINTVSSTVKLTESNNQKITNKKMQVSIFGGAQYSTDSTETEIWKYLEGTKSEAEEIISIFNKNDIKNEGFFGLLASEKNFKSKNNESSPDILHIATHGFFYPNPKDVVKEEKLVDNSSVVFRGGNRGLGLQSFVNNNNSLMRSGLVFAGANDVWSKNKISGEDGVLTAYEVSNMNLPNTKLVVMSACETGLGDIKGSEGVYGLQRAFKMAGVDFLIMSLWQVPDKETAEFMTSFYKKLIKQKDIKQAFNYTQKEMRVKYDPYYWAAFILIE